jgi:adenylate cyclase
MPDGVEQAEAWMESSAGESWAVGANSSIGRSLNNQVVLPESKVSRRHAIIHSQGQHEYWLVDLGSSNGTYLNGRRVSQPTRLQDRDQVTIGDSRLTFRQKHTPTASLSAVNDATITEIRHGRCWLLLADIVGSTQISRQLTPQDLSMMIGQWLAWSKEVIERNNGAINKFLGDGFFAYWDDKTSPETLARTLKELREGQDRAQPVFRVVLHYGDVAMGGASMGEESLVGSSVNMVFRIEKLASALGESRLMSKAAQTLLAPHLPTTSVGEHELQGFAGKETYYSF